MARHWSSFVSVSARQARALDKMAEATAEFGDGMDLLQEVSGSSRSGVGRMDSLTVSRHVDECFARWGRGAAPAAPETARSGADILLDHITRCTGADALLVVDGSADDTITQLLAAGWTLDEGSEVVAGKRIRTVHPPEGKQIRPPESEDGR